MPLIEIKFLKLKYLPFFILLVYFYLFNTYPSFFLGGIQVTKINFDLINSISLVSTEMLYFISQICNIQRRRQIKKRLQIKEIIFLLLPGIMLTLFTVLELFSSKIFCFPETFTDITAPIIFPTISLVLAVHFGSKCFQKNKLHIHHKISLTMIFSSTIIFLLLFSYLCILENTSFLFSSFECFGLSSVRFISYFLTAFSYVIQKHLIQYYFHNMYHVQFMTGLRNILTLLPFVLIMKLFPDYTNTLEITLGYINTLKLFIICSFENYIMIMVINNLSPMYAVFLILFIIPLPLERSTENKKTFKLLWIIHSFIIVIGFFLYTEAILINACSLTFNAETNIRKRGEDEFELSRKEYNYSFGEKISKFDE
jgi:hypothetical protein